MYSGSIVRSSLRTPSSRRLTSSCSIGVLPTRSPMPRAVPCTRVAPACSAASVLGRPRPRSRCPCQSMPTRSATPSSSRRLFTHSTRFITPSGMAAPTVSQRHTRLAPASTAAVRSSRRCSGEDRTVSSVTYMTSSPSLTAYSMASRVCRRMCSMSHSSAYCRMGLLPMKRQASIGTPVFCESSAMGWMSTMSVRPAQLGRIRRFDSSISRHRRSTASRCRGPAPGRPTLAVSMPRASMSRRIPILASIDGSRTDGLCRPSRSVSSSSIATTGLRNACGPASAHS